MRKALAFFIAAVAAVLLAYVVLVKPAVEVSSLPEETPHCPSVRTQAATNVFDVKEFAAALQGSNDGQRCRLDIENGPAIWMPCHLPVEAGVEITIEARPAKDSRDSEREALRIENCDSRNGLALELIDLKDQFASTTSASPDCPLILQCSFESVAVHTAMRAVCGCNVQAQHLLSGEEVRGMGVKRIAALAAERLHENTGFSCVLPQAVGARNQTNLQGPAISVDD